MQVNLNLTNIKDLEDGIYPVRVESVEQTKSKSSGNPMLKVTFNVIDSNRKLFDNFSFQDSALFKLRDFLVATNITFDENGFDDQELIGREVRVQVQNEMYEGKSRPKIVAFFSIA